MWHLCGKVTDILTVQRKLLYTTAVSRRRSYYDSLELSLFRGHAAWLILSGSQMWNNIEIKLQWHCSVSVLLQFYFTLVSRFRYDMQNFDMHMGLTQLSVCCLKQSCRSTNSFARGFHSRHLECAVTSCSVRPDARLLDAAATRNVNFAMTNEQAPAAAAST